MPRLLVFNPEHDYALSQKEGFSNFRKGIVALAKKMQFLPAIWGDREDFILSADNKIYTVSDLNSPVPTEKAIENICSIEPWGWDYPLVYRLCAIGVDDSMLPRHDDIEWIKKLSHRNCTIALNKFLNHKNIPTEFTNVELAMQFYFSNQDCFFKAPWSSSGRGVINTAIISQERIREWITGTIRLQGSVLAEKKEDKTLEFASLWTCENGRASFRGVSVTRSFPNGCYGGNLCGTQDKLLATITGLTSSRIYDIFDLQYQYIQKNIAERYNGRLGIDMFVCKDGSITPGVEINLRNTMGHAAMDYNERLMSADCDNLISDPFSLFIML